MQLPITTTRIQLRFSDTDAVGHISSGSYITYLELARTDFLTELSKVSEVPMNVVVNINIDYISETMYGEDVYVTTWCSKLGNKSMTLSSEIYANDRLVSRGQATVVGFDLASRTSVALPSSWEASSGVNIK